MSQPITPVSVSVPKTSQQNNDSPRSSLVPFLGLLYTGALLGMAVYNIYQRRTLTPVKNNLPAIDALPTFTVKSKVYQGSYWNPLPEQVISRIHGKSYKQDCPVPLADLAYVQVRHYNLRGEICTGELIYHKNLAKEIIEIFQELFEKRYPIEKMVLIDNYDANDDRSMEDNNSSAFCSRPITGQQGNFSKHSYGGTIDINPLHNPYVKGDLILPKNGSQFANREVSHPCIIRKGDDVYNAFIKRGYEWGGEWTRLQDYQHFEKNPKLFT